VIVAVLRRVQIFLLTYLLTYRETYIHTTNVTRKAICVCASHSIADANVIKRQTYDTSYSLQHITYAHSRVEGLSRHIACKESKVK